MIYVLTMPGALGLLGASGSFIRPDIKAAARSLGLRIRLMSDRTPTLAGARKFVRRGDRRTNSLLLCGKSMGGAKVIERVLKKTYQEFGGYKKLALLTVDPFGLLYGHKQAKGNFNLPKSLTQSENFHAINLYQRNSGMQGALVWGALNLQLRSHPDGSKVTHMNIVDHPEIAQHARNLLVWLST